MPIFRRTKTLCYCIWCTALVLLDVVGSGCGALRCRVRAVWYKVCLKCELPVSGVPQLGCGRKELVHKYTAHSPHSGDTVAHKALFLFPITVNRIFQHSTLAKT